MIYMLNGRIVGLGATKYMTEAERKREASGVDAKLAAAKAKLAAAKAKTFAELDAEWQANKGVAMAPYRKFVKEVPYEVREELWIRAGKPTHPHLLMSLRRKRLVSGKDLVKDWDKREQQMANAQTYVAAAANAVQAVQEAMPQVPQAQIVESAARVVSTAISGGGSSGATAAAGQVAAESATPASVAQAGGNTPLVGAGLAAAAGLLLAFWK